MGEYETEIWKPIKQTNGKYEVSNLGRIKSTYRERKTGGVTRRYPGGIIIGNNNGNGYLYFSYIENGKDKHIYIHRAVAEAFLEHPAGATVINHKDYNKSNNRVENLEWCTQKENIHYSTINMRRQHATKPGKTNHKYIHRREDKGKYRVCIPRLKVDRQFNVLEDAIRFRDEVLNEICLSN